MSYQHDGAALRSEIETSAPDWTETACLILTAIGTGYFTGHLIVALVRGALS